MVGSFSNYRYELDFLEAGELFFNKILVTRSMIYTKRRQIRTTPISYFNLKIP